MSQQNSGQMINVPNTLRMKVGGRMGGIDPAAIARAEAALQNLSGNFAGWLRDEVEKLDAARQMIREQGLNAETGEALYLRSHDLKGLGATYGFPLITRVAALLCRLIEDKSKRTDAPLGLVDAHIDAIKAAVRDDIKTVDHPIGKALVDELERRVVELGA